MVTKVLVRSTKNPDYPSLDTSRLDAVASYLSARNLLQSSERVLRIEDAGTSARNHTLRVVTDSRSIVLKRFQDWHTRGVVAPCAWERFRAECQFHRAARIAGCADAALPSLLHHDAQGRCILYEDVGPGSAEAHPPTDNQAASLAWFLVNLHHHSQSVPLSARYDNAVVRQWLAARLFAQHQPGATHRGIWLRRLAGSGPAVRESLAEARIVVGRACGSLVHGDFVPRNWVGNGEEIRVVDSEFSFFGQPELDAGSFLAGLMFSRAARGVLAAGVDVLETGCMRYDPALVTAFAGAHLCVMLEGARRGDGAPRGPEACALVRRVARAIAGRSLRALI